MMLLVEAEQGMQVLTVGDVEDSQWRMLAARRGWVVNATMHHVVAGRWGMGLGQDTVRRADIVLESKV